MNVKFDKQTEAWIRKHLCQQTTICRCDVCGLFYKPILGHKCKKSLDMQEETT